MKESTFTDGRTMDALKRSEAGVAAPVNAVWSMDFMHDLFKDGRSIRLFNVIDDFNRRAWESRSTSRCPLRVSFEPWRRSSAGGASRWRYGVTTTRST